MKYPLYELPPFHYHPPKTAGSSIISLLLKRYPLYRKTYGHIYPSMTDNAVHATALYSGLSRTTPGSISVRNPYTRYTSILAWYIKHNVLPNNYTMKNLARDMIRNKRNPLVSDGFQSIMYAPCYNWHRNNNITDIIYFEHLDRDLKATYNVSLDYLEHIHLQEDTERLSKLCDYSINVINEIAEDDFKMYGYSMITSVGQLENYCVKPLDK